MAQSYQEIKQDIDKIPDAELQNALERTYWVTTQQDFSPEEIEMIRKAILERIEKLSNAPEKSSEIRNFNEEWIVQHRNNLIINDLKFYFPLFYDKPFEIGNGNYYLDNLTNILADLIKEVLDEVGGWLPADPFKSVFWELVRYDDTYCISSNDKPDIHNTYINQVYEVYFKNFGNSLKDKISSYLCGWTVREKEAFENEANALDEEIEAQFKFGCKEAAWAAVSWCGGKLIGKVAGKIKNRARQAENAAQTINGMSQKQLAANAKLRNPTRADQLARENRVLQESLRVRDVSSAAAKRQGYKASRKLAANQKLNTERLLASEESVHMMEQAIKANIRWNVGAAAVETFGVVAPGVATKIADYETWDPYKKNHNINGKEFNVFVEIFGETGDMIIGFLPVGGTVQSAINIALSAAISVGGVAFAAYNRYEHNQKMESVDEKNSQLIMDLDNIIFQNDVESLVRSVAKIRHLQLWEVNM